MALGVCQFTPSRCYEGVDQNASIDNQLHQVAFRKSSSLAYYFVDASFVRWLELSVRAEVPTRFLQRVRANGATLTVAGRNLALWTKEYEGADPEPNWAP